MRMVAVALIVSLGVMHVGAQELSTANLLTNPSFEDVPGDVREPPNGWEYYTSSKRMLTVTSEQHGQGAKCVYLKAQEMPNQYQGIIQRIGVSAGQTYTLCLSVINDKLHPLGGSAKLQMTVEWRTQSNREISRSVAPYLDYTLSRMRWESPCLRKVVAPEGAELAVFGLHFLEGDKGGKGGVYVDDFSVTSP